MAELAIPKHYALSREAPVLEAGDAYIKKRVILSVVSVNVNNKRSILFTLKEVAPSGKPVIINSPNGSYLAVEESIELTIELDKDTDWHWDRTNSGPLTLKNENGADFFGGVQGKAVQHDKDDKEVVFYIKYNRMDEPPELGVAFDLNFHVAFIQTNSAKLAVTIDPQVVNPPPINREPPPVRSVFAVL